MRSGKIGLRAGWNLIIIVGLAASACQPSYDRNDPILQKPVDELTDAELSRVVTVFETNYGRFKIELHPEWAPRTCRHFLKLAKSGFYDGLSIHEVRPNLWIRGGDPKGDGTGGPGYTIPLELPSGKHVKGAAGLYHSTFENEVGSQFYIMLQVNVQLDGAFPVFGMVIDGLPTVERIGKLPVTPRDGKPLPYMPLSPVIIRDVHLEAKAIE